MSDAEWPVALSGVTESVVTTLGPNGLWNVAALGLHGPDRPTGTDPADGGEEGSDDESEEYRITARTWGRTRTWRNFRERGEGYVQFTVDPVDFAEAALAVREESEPVLDGVDAWARVTVERLDTGESGGTEWTDWGLAPVESAVERESVRTIDRGRAAVVEATVAASRLGVSSYDEGALLDRLRYFEGVVESAGDARERAAFERVRELTDAEW